MEIKLDKISYKEKITKSIEILHEITVKISSGEITGIIGNKGCGKSTLIEMLGALKNPTNGSIFLDEKVINKKIPASLRKKVGIVFENPEEQLFSDTVLGEVSFGIKNFDGSKKDCYETVKKLIELVELDESYLPLNPFELSCGEKRKVSIAAALSYNPEILLFDEPTTGLDDRSKESIKKLLLNLKNKHHKTIVIASSDVDFLYSFADNFIILVDGKLVLSAPKSEAFKRVRYLKNINIPIPQIVWFIHRVASKTGIKLELYDNIHDLIKAIYRNV